MVICVDKPYQLLIADDNRSFRAVLRDVLGQLHSVELHEAESGEEAVDVVRTTRIDIVLIDLHMHIMTGLDAMRILKQLDALRPCILITSDTSEDVRRDAADAEAFAVLRKPVAQRELITSVSDALTVAYDADVS
jgi:CheY-like chemotaxis protein